jgi:hypothetical protein
MMRRVTPILRWLMDRLGWRARRTEEAAPATGHPQTATVLFNPVLKRVEEKPKVDVAICIYGKPFHTALTIASLLHHSGQHIGRIFLQREASQPHGVDIAPLMKTFADTRFVHVEPRHHLGIAFSSGADFADVDYRRSIRYQQAWEDSEQDFIFLSHNDCNYLDDVIGGMLLRLAPGPYTGVGLIGQCWNCPANHAQICSHDKFGSVDLSYEQAITIVRDYPGPRTIERGIEPDYPTLFPECRLNEFACLIDLKKARPDTHPSGSAPPFATLYTDTGTEWFRHMVRKGHRFLNWYEGVVHAPFSDNANGFAADRDADIYRTSEARAASYLEEHYPETYDALVANIGQPVRPSVMKDLPQPLP